MTLFTELDLSHVLREAAVGFKKATGSELSDELQTRLLAHGRKEEMNAGDFEQYLEDQLYPKRAEAFGQGSFLDALASA